MAAIVYGVEYYRSTARWGVEAGNESGKWPQVNLMCHLSSKNEAEKAGQMVQTALNWRGCPSAKLQTKIFPTQFSSPNMICEAWPWCLVERWEEKLDIARFKPPNLHFRCGRQAKCKHKVCFEFSNTILFCWCRYGPFRGSRRSHWGRAHLSRRNKRPEFSSTVFRALKSAPKTTRSWYVNVF